MHNLCDVNCFEIGDHWLSVPLKNAKGNRKACMLCRSWLKSLLFIPVCLLLKKKTTAKIQKLLGVTGWKRIGVEIQWLCLSINVLFVGIWDWKPNIFALFEIHMEYVTCSKGCGTWFRYCVVLIFCSGLDDPSCYLRFSDVAQMNLTLHSSIKTSC